MIHFSTTDSPSAIVELSETRRMANRIAIYVAGLAVVIVSALRGWTDIWLKWLLSLLPQRAAFRLGPAADHFFEGMKGLNRARAVSPIAFLALLCWLLHGMYYFFPSKRSILTSPFGQP